MKRESHTSQPTSLPASDPSAEIPAGTQSVPRSSLKLAGTPQLTAEEYERVLQQVAADLFLNDEHFRKAVVLREVRKVVLGWGTAIGIGSVIAVATLYVNARDALKQSTSTELSKAVKEHVSSRTELLNESIKSLTNTAVGQIVHVQKELEGAQNALDRSEQQLALANQQSADLQRRIASISETLKLVQQNAAWLGDIQNAQRVASFIRTLSQERNAKAIGDLLVRLDRVEALQIESEIVRSAASNEAQRRAVMADLNRLILNASKEQQGKVDPAKSHAFDKWDAYIKGADPAK
jgi:hypothetical protein